MSDPHWTDFFELLERNTRAFLRTVFYCAAIAFVAICALLLTTCKVFAAGGHYDNDIEGKTVLYDVQGECERFVGARMGQVKALDKHGNVRHTGCWFVYNNNSIVIFWKNGPATVVQPHKIEWVSDDEALPKALGV